MKEDLLFGIEVMLAKVETYLMDMQNIETNRKPDQIVCSEMKKEHSQAGKRERIQKLLKHS